MSIDEAVAKETTTPPATRIVVSLSPGARICLLLGALLLVFAGYLFWGPTGHNVPGGFPAKCGSAAQPPSNGLGKAVCGATNDIRGAEALATLVAAIVLAGGGALAFGVIRKEPREASPADES